MVRVRIASVRKIGLVSVADVEEVAEHLDGVALLAFAEQGRHRYVEVLPQQIEQCRFDRRDRVDRRAQVERLKPTAAGIPVRELLLDAGEQALMGADGLSDDERTRVLQGLADLLAARNLTDAGAPRRIAQEQEVSREERSMRATQVQQHAVPAGDRNDGQRGDNGGGRWRQGRCRR